MASEISSHKSWKPFYESVPVTVIVGPESCKRTFYINEDLLTWHSKYFRAALNGNFSEGQTKIVRLEEDDPSAFERFVRFLIQSPCSGRDDELWSTSSEDYPSQLIDFYVLGDKLLAEGFKDRIATDLKDSLKDDTIQMSSLLVLAKSIYQLTSKSGGATIRSVLTWYCAVGMGPSRGTARWDIGDSRVTVVNAGWNTSAETTESWVPARWGGMAESWGVARPRLWHNDEKELFLSCGLEDFQKDVLDVLCRSSGDPLEPEVGTW